MKEEQVSKGNPRIRANKHASLISVTVLPDSLFAQYFSM